MMSSSRPFVIWCRQRTGSISLFNALTSLSEHPAAESEPFDGSVEDRQFCVANLLPVPRRDEMLRSICDRPWLIKHVYGLFAVPLDFNLALARISTEAGYRHIHLARRSEFARLASLGIAENEVTWITCRATFDTFAALRNGGRKMRALDVVSLLARSREADRQWRALDRCLPRCLLLWTEDITSRFRTRRHASLARLCDHLEISRAAMGRLDEALENGGQDTHRNWDLVPNLSQLREAVA